MEKPVGERVRLPVGLAVQQVRSVVLARHHQHAPVEPREVPGQAVPAVLDHEAPIGVARHHGEPAVVVGVRIRRGRIEVSDPRTRAQLVEEEAVCRDLGAPFLHQPRHSFTHELGKGRDDDTGMPAVHVHHGLAVFVEDGDVFGRGQRPHRRRVVGPPADVQVWHHELAERVRRLDNGGEVGVRTRVGIRGQEVGIALVVSAGLERDRVEEGRRGEPE